jgi:hypothetical protein
VVDNRGVSTPAEVKARLDAERRGEPGRLVLDYRLGDGLALRRSGDPEQAAVVVRGEKTVATTSKVVAFDADGRPVPVHSSVHGEQLVIEVDHRGRDLRYPLLVDPTTYLWENASTGSSRAYDVGYR